MNPPGCPGARALWLMILEVPRALPDTFLTAARLISPLHRPHPNSTHRPLTHEVPRLPNNGQRIL